MYFYFKSIRVIILTSELVAMGTIRNKTTIKVTPKQHPYWKIKLRRGTPRKMENPAAENRIFCRGKSWALVIWETVFTGQKTQPTVSKYWRRGYKQEQMANSCCPLSCQGPEDLSVSVSTGRIMKDDCCLIKGSHTEQMGSKQFPNKRWTVASINCLLEQTDNYVSMERMSGSGRPRSVMI